ncbi:YqaA family protein [Gallaecimonas xiamenensis]|uniref:DedA family membrane protein n=1 Tax=Gallaecimonas xiamenensis 3-C-1 TaxID=745411 RepID=K2JMJ9_9GAMM|nr:YqaA family protein [Gallaecimonas xiamenensis]EKE71669.1 DedA family membrane protein [Gallaecimonas xiamenensis 3-C-1]
MKIFSPFYDRVLRWAAHPHAPRYLAVMSFVESIFWPVPTDVMLAPMALARPARAWRFALVATVASVLGGAVGFALGWLLFEPVVLPFVEWMGYQAKLATAKTWFDSYGIWVVLLASFSPLPYKVFTVTAGVMQMLFLPFMLVSLVGRAARFYLVAGLMRLGGARMAEKLRHYIDWLGWATVLLAVAAYLALR